LNIKSTPIQNKTIISNIDNIKRENKYFSPSNKEWSNSIYSFNKNTTKSIPVLDNVILKIIKIYFNIYNIKTEKTVRMNNLTKRKRWLSSRKLWVSKTELKHTNDKVIINLYIYDRINNIILSKFRNYLKNFFKWKALNMTEKKVLIKSLSQDTNNTKYQIDHNKDNKIFKRYEILLENKNNKLNNLFNKNLDNNWSNNEKFLNYVKIFLDKINLKFYKKVLKREMKILYYKKFLWLNTLKYKNSFLVILQKLIGKVYNKHIIFNIVCLKNYFLDSDILTQILSHKTKDRNRKISKIFMKTLVNIKTPLFRKNIMNKIIKGKHSQNIAIKYKNVNNLNDNLNIVLKDFYNKNLNNTEDHIIDNLRNKLIVGIRLQASGRLTRRFTAQRAVKNIKYVGTLKTIDSSFKGLSTQMLRNNINNNIQHSKSNSQNRIGSFGIKGWINSI
jgi:hypothetical protein